MLPIQPARYVDLRSGRGRRRAVSESDARPRMAILPGQGVNGQIEMAAAFDVRVSPPSTFT